MPFLKKYWKFLLTVSLILIVIILAWSPWVTNDFAQNRLKTYSPCPQLAVVPDFKSPQSTQKTFFGRKLIKVVSSCGTYDLFVSAFGTVHQLKFYKTDDNTKTNTTVPTDKASAPEPNTGPIKTIGVNLDYYNSATGRAGDFLFTRKKLQFGRVFIPYGFVIPGNNTSSGSDKANPQPTFVVPTGTKVLSLVDGVVFDTPKVWSGDYSIQVTAAGQSNGLIYETEHVINPLVKKGDSVKAGQVIAEVSDFDKNAPAGYGTVEIGVLDGSGGTPKHLCPFLYLDPSVKQQILTKLQDLMKNWETYIGDASLYDESLAVPGCQTLDPIPG